VTSRRRSSAGPCYVPLVSALPSEILSEARSLFEDVRPEDIDAGAHAPFVIARVLDRGTVRSVAALLRLYGEDRIAAFLREGGTSQVSPRTVPLWRAYLKLSEEECTPRSSARSRSPYCTD
jgi:hypothetical protein